MMTNNPYGNLIRRLRLDNLEIAYIDEGEGEILLFVHGYLCDLSLFRFAYPFFQKRYRVIGLDLPGAGYSDKPDIAYNPDFLAGIVEAFIAKLGLRRVTLIGLSMGGLIAVKTALRLPDRISRLVLIDSAGMVKFNAQMRNQVLLGRSEESAKRQDDDYFRERAKFYFYAEDEGYRLFVDLLTRKTREPDFDKLAVAQFRCFCSMTEDEAYIGDQLPQVACPVLILWGANDRALPPVLGEFMRAGLKKAAIAIAEDCGHILALEKPAFMNERIDAFLREAVS